MSPAIMRVGLVIVTIATFWPVLFAKFGAWDDAMNVYQNPRLLPPTWESVAHYWRHFEADLYVPLTYTVWAAVARFSYSPQTATLNPHDFHLLNLTLHIGAVLAAFELLRRCVNNDVLAAGAGALLFAVHPLQVEPVAWVAGMKDVLAGALAIVALWQYLSASGRSARTAICWAIATASFILAMLAKPSAVVTPALALLLDRFIAGRDWSAALRRGLPWFVLAIPCIVWTRLAQAASTGSGANTIWMRPLVAADTIAFYLWKLVWPIHLGVDYGRTPQYAIERGWVYFTWLAPAVLALVIVVASRRSRVLLGALLIFVVALSPVLGFIPFDYQAYSTVADHYMYLPMIAVALAAAWIISRVSIRLRPLTITLVGLMLLTLAGLSKRQCSYWLDAITLFEHAVDVNPRSWAAHNTLSVAYTVSDDRERALEHAKLAVEYNPDAVLARFSLAVALANAGHIDEAIDAYRDLLRRDANHIAGRLQLAILLAEKGNRAGAIEQYRAILNVNPGNTEARAGLARFEAPATSEPSGLR